MNAHSKVSSHDRSLATSQYSSSENISADKVLFPNRGLLSSAVSYSRNTQAAAVQFQRAYILNNTIECNCKLGNEQATLLTRNKSHNERYNVDANETAET